ncbi:MAG: hypothetical protein IPM13_18670 [Phycisphaerales bacterium]|nr:hypothetical protein [Phycisphaerales bacterium]
MAHGPSRHDPGRHAWLLDFEDGRTELYDLANDPGEAHDLAATRPDDATKLRTRLAAWRKDLGAAMPVRK